MAKVLPAGRGFALVLACAVPGAGLPASCASTELAAWSLSTGIMRDLGSIATVRPPDVVEWVLLGSALAGAITLAPNDVRIYRAFHEEIPNPSYRGTTVAHFASLFGRGEIQLDLLLGLAAVGGARERKAALAAAEALVITGFVVSSLKLVTGVARPSDSPNRRAWNHQAIRHDAFPSGHTAVAFAVASVLGEAYGIPWPLYAAAALVGCARIAEGTHWPSDVVVGAMIGTVIGRRAALLHGFDADFRATPLPGGGALELSRRF